MSENAKDNEAGMPEEGSDTGLPDALDEDLGADEEGLDGILDEGEGEGDENVDLDSLLKDCAGLGEEDSAEGDAAGGEEGLPGKEEPAPEAQNEPVAAEPEPAPEPVPENLGQLREAVVGCDLGIAVDPDSDRCVLIDEKGNPLVEEYTLALAVHLLLSKYGVKAPVCRNASTSRAIDDICAQNGVTCYATKIGEVNVAVKMAEVKSVIGGEGNGGVMLEPCHIGRDAVVAAGLVLQLFALEREKKPGITISEIKASLPQWRIGKMKIDLKPGCPIDKLIEQWKGDLKKEHGDAVSFNEIDGLRVDHRDWWVHVRKSNTEPVVRVIGEGHTQEEADAVCKKVFDQFQKLMQ